MIFLHKYLINTYWYKKYQMRTKIWQLFEISAHPSIQAPSLTLKFLIIFSKLDKSQSLFNPFGCIINLTIEWRCRRNVGSDFVVRSRRKALRGSWGNAHNRGLRPNSISLVIIWLCKRFRVQFTLFMMHDLIKVGSLWPYGPLDPSCDFVLRRPLAKPGKTPMTGFVRGGVGG